MTAIIIALGRNPSFEGLQDHFPVPLLPLGDKPFLQHIIENLASQGIRHFDFILSHLPEKIESALGDGSRWGCRFHFHLLPFNVAPLRLASTISAITADASVLGNAEILPEADLAATPPGSLFFKGDTWTGWGVFSPGVLDLSELGQFDHLQISRFLSVESGHDFLRSQRAILDGTFPGVLIAGPRTDPGIWISRNVALHPTATLRPPVYIGENCRIGRAAQLGPSAVIGPNCIIGEQTAVYNSMVAAGTYVGEGLELDSVIVDRNWLFNVRLETSLLASETFLLGSLTGRASARVWARVFSALVAALILFFFWPVLLITRVYLAVGKAGSFEREPVVRIPADDDPGTWKEDFIVTYRRTGHCGRAAEFFLHFLPGLFSVLQGRLFLVGVQPRSRSELLAIPEDWRALYLKTKAGLVTEAAVTFGRTPSQDELYTSEAFYSATETIGHDIRLFGLWLWKLVTGFRKARLETIKEV